MDFTSWVGTYGAVFVVPERSSGKWDSSRFNYSQLRHNVHNKDRYFKNTESETTNPVFSLRYRNLSRGQCFRSPSYTLGKIRPTVSFWISTCEWCTCTQLWNWKKDLFLDEKQHGGAPGAPFCNLCVQMGVTGAPSRCDLLSCASKGVSRWVCFVVSSSRAEMLGKGCGHAADRARGWVCGLVPTHAGYQGEEPAASSTWVPVHVIRPVPRNIAATLL